MRVLILAVALSTAMAAPAAAQGLYADSLTRKPGVDAKETSPIQRLHPDARRWIAEERARQKAQPGDLIELAVDIESEIGPAVLKVAKRERIGAGDLILVIMYDIINGANEDLADELRRMRAAGAPAADIETASASKATLEARLAEVIEGQTVVSRSLTPGLWAQ